MKYLKFREERAKKINNFPMFFAFNKKQMEDGKKKINLKENEKLISIGAGGFINSKDKQAFINMNKDFEKELKIFISDDEQFKEALLEELKNHEYCYAFDESDALAVFGLDLSTLTERESKILKEAKISYSEYIKDFDL